MNWREYHEATKHTVEAVRRSAHTLDWANMPDPFRHYEGVPVLDLPADPPIPGAPATDVLLGALGSTDAADGAAFLSQLLYHAAAISAAKRVPSTGQKYALRVNPSSGNLHPTEFHFLTRGVLDWPDGFYHYRASAHMAEQRALGDFEAKLTDIFSPVVFVLTSIAWREAWKYQDRAYRYCLLDIGHAWEALATAARALGCESFAIGHFPDDDVAGFCGLPEDEWPMLIVGLHGRTIPQREPEGGEIVWTGGEANRLSENVHAYSSIESIHAATKLSGKAGGICGVPQTRSGLGDVKLPSPARPAEAFGEVARRRRSALDFRGGSRSISMEQLSTLLAAATAKRDADFGVSPLVQLYLYAHRVDGLAPGVYRHWPASGELETMQTGDQRVMAAALSLGQDLAGNACVAFSMIADLERATQTFGERGYRYAHFEAGMIGNRLYLAAEALGLQATGIGAFYDDEVHAYLRIAPEQGQVIYHFAVGYAVPDDRLVA